MPANDSETYYTSTLTISSLNFIMMIYMMPIISLWNFIAGSLNGTGTMVKSLVIRYKHCHMQIVLFIQEIGELLKITFTLPVTSCECKRSNGALKRLKTYLHSTMDHER